MSPRPPRPESDRARRRREARQSEPAPSRSPSSPGRRGLVYLAVVLLGGLAIGLFMYRRAGDAPTIEARVIADYPHDPEAFTQGLLFADGKLWESTGREGLSSLRKVDLATGRVEVSHPLAGELFGEGLTLAGDRLVQLTWKNRRALIWSHPDLERRGSFEYSGEGWGLTFDGVDFISSDGSSRLVFRDRESFLPKREIAVRDGSQIVDRLNELEWIEGEIWANVWHSDRIARIDPETGRVRSWIDLSGLWEPEGGRDREACLNGIAYDAATGRIFVTGKLWPRLFEIRVPKGKG